MKRKLKVLSADRTPEKAVRRVVLSRDDSPSDWVRNTMDNTFMLWSVSMRFPPDTIWDKDTRRMVDCPSPFVKDEDGNDTLRKDIIAFYVDVYEHSGRHYYLHGSRHSSDPWDTCLNACILYTTEERWNEMCGNCEWKFVDGRPTKELEDAARAIAESEIELMNLDEDGCYYRYQEERFFRETGTVRRIEWDGEESESEHYNEGWEDDGDSCGGILTDHPARDADFPLGVPVVTHDTYLVDDTFEQECFALRAANGRYVRSSGGRHLTGDLQKALLASRQFLENNLKAYEKEVDAKLEITDVTDDVWGMYPECLDNQ